MQVKELEIINQYALENNIKLDYKKIIQLKKEDISLLIRKIHEKNKNVKALITFFTCELNCPNWTEFFHHLNGIDEFDIRIYLIKRVLNANSVKEAQKILSYCDEERCIHLFHTVEEWKTYLKGIRENMSSITVFNVYMVLKIASDNKNELLKQVMEYSQNKDFDSKVISNYIEEDILKQYLEEILCLLNLGYPTEEIAEFFKKAYFYNNWNEDIYNYLKNNTYSKEEKCDLIQIFNRISTEEYEKTLGILRRIEVQRDKELFGGVLKNKKTENPTMYRYYNEIILCSPNELDYKQSLFKLLNEGIISKYADKEDIIQNILKVLNKVKKYDGNIEEITNFIIKPPIPEMINRMSIEKENLDTRNIIYQEFPKCLKTEPFTEEQIEYYGKWLEELSKLPSDICQKILDILKLSVVKKLTLEGQMNLQTMLLAKENYGSLDYVYHEYLEKEQEFNHDKNIELADNQLTPLVTVIELLENGSDISQVLNGFSGEDEITGNTLVRSLAYKNEQNN